jgi:hypothetical protein
MVAYFTNIYFQSLKFMLEKEFERIYIVIFIICSCAQLLLRSQIVYINKVCLFMLFDNVYKDRFFLQEKKKFN